MLINKLGNNVEEAIILYGSEYFKEGNYEQWFF